MSTPMPTELSEQWRPVAGYKDRYEVSDHGRVRRPLNCIREGNRTVPGSLLRPSLDLDGYRGVILCLHGKTHRYKIARLVAEAFIPNPDHKSEVNHSDFCKTNDHVSNLEWTSHVEN